MFNILFIIQHKVFNFNYDLYYLAFGLIEIKAALGGVSQKIPRL